MADPPYNMSSDLADDFHRLAIAAPRSISPLPPPSPTPERRSPSRASERIRNASTPVSKTPALRKTHSTVSLRKTPSTASLRDERRLSTPGLQKRASTTSLRSASMSRDAHPSLSRRSSHNLLGAMYSPLETPLEAAPTASSIATDHFQSELRLHETVDLQSKTVVIIQDACYGHRYSRPYTSRDGLATIVERPERLRASVLGVSTAYIRVGKRHAGSLFAPRPDLDLNILPPPPFQIRKSSRAVPLNSAAVTYVHGDRWMGDLKSMCDAAESRLELNGREVVRPRSAGRKDNGEKPLHDGDLYLCPESLDAFQGALGGVCDAVDTVLTHGATKRAFVCVRPPGHHCASVDPSGFCWLNNVHVGIAHAAMTHGLTHAAIIDFDLHHGDGSQEIVYKQNEQAWNLHQRGGATARNAAPCKKTAIGYYSLHDINSFPCENGEADKIVNASVCIDNAHGQSIWNVHLEPWKTHDEFWKLYHNKYAILLEKARNFLRFHTQRLEATEGTPKAAIFISAGFDASEFEGAGMQRHKVNVPTDFYARFTADIVRLAEEEGLGTDGRIISVLEGGYSNRALSSGVLSHLSALADNNISTTTPQSRLALEMSGRLGLSSGLGSGLGSGFGNGLGNGDAEFKSVPAFETDWWATNLLEELETLAFPPPPPIKKPQKSAPTYFSPTQASTAKVVKERKLSATSTTDGHSSEPLPEVDWATSAYELWKCLLPNDRETTSFQFEDLKARAALAKKKKTSPPTPTPTTPSGARMQLRARATKTTSPETPSGAKVSTSTPRRVSSRSTSSHNNNNNNNNNNSRRTTIGTASDLSEPPKSSSSSSTRDARRRQSATGTVLDAAAGGSKTQSQSQSQSQPQPQPQTQTPTRASSSSQPPSQSPASAVAGRKMRVSAGSRTSTPKRAVNAERVPPLPKVPSLYMNTDTNMNTSSKSSQGQGVADSSSGDVDTVDDVSAGVKKLSIKLKVPSPEENSRREKKVPGGPEQKKKVATSKKPELAKPPFAKINRGVAIAPKTAAEKTQPQPQPQSQSQSQLPTKPRNESEYEIPIKIDIPSEPVHLQTSVPDHSKSNGSGLGSYQGFSTAPTTQSPHFQLPMSPVSPLGFPSPAPPEMVSAQSTRDNLPVFTSTSAIPFAPVPVPVSVPVSERQGYHQPGYQQGPFLQQAGVYNPALQNPPQPQPQPQNQNQNQNHEAVE